MRFKKHNSKEALVRAITIVEREYGVRIDGSYPWFTFLEQAEELIRERQNTVVE